MSRLPTNITLKDRAKQFRIMQVIVRKKKKHTKTLQIASQILKKEEKKPPQNQTF